MIGSLKQVRRYFTDQAIRHQVRLRLLDAITDRTSVIVAHSLGSVVAYETLFAAQAYPVTTLITLGSPLGLPNLIFHRLAPAPATEFGAWPGRVQHWTNIADMGDVVAKSAEASSGLRTERSRRRHSQRNQSSRRAALSHYSRDRIGCAGWLGPLTLVGCSQGSTRLATARSRRSAAARLPIRPIACTFPIGNGAAERSTGPATAQGRSHGEIYATAQGSDRASQLICAHDGLPVVTERSRREGPGRRGRR